MKNETLEYQKQEIGQRWRKKFLSTPSVRRIQVMASLMWQTYFLITREAKKNNMTLDELLNSWTSIKKTEMK